MHAHKKKRYHVPYFYFIEMYTRNVQVRKTERMFPPVSSNRPSSVAIATLRVVPCTLMHRWLYVTNAPDDVESLRLRLRLWAAAPHRCRTGR